MDDNALKEKVENSFSKYTKNAGIENLLYTIAKQFNMPFVPMYLEAYLNEDTGKVTPHRIVINKSHINDHYFDLSLCHELGHIKDLLKSENERYAETKRFWQHIASEVRADKEAVNIYNQPKTVKKDMMVWIYMKIKRICKEDFYWKDIVLNVARLLVIIMRF